MSDIRTDNVKDVTEAFLNVSTVSVTDVGATTTFAHELFGNISDDAFNKFSSLDYFVLANLDADPATGGAPSALGIPTAFQGAELVTRVRVLPQAPPAIQAATAKTVIATAWRFSDGEFIEISDTSIKARIEELITHIDTEEEQPINVMTSNMITIGLANAVRGPVSATFRVQALSVGNPVVGATPVVDRLDDSTGELGREFRLRSPTFPVCTVEPNTAPRGDTAIVNVTGLLPNSGIHVVFGDTVVANGFADTSGAAKVSFAVPAGATEGPHLITAGSDGTALTANCTVTVLPPTPVPTCFGKDATIVGTNRNDILKGTSGDNVIVGLDGKDIIKGKGGNDLICGGNGKDAINGGRGSDKIDGGAGKDVLIGGPGTDTCINGEIIAGCP